MVMIPTSSKRSLRSLPRTSRVSSPIRSRRSRVSPSNAPRGTAMRRSLTAARSLCAAAFLAGEGDVHPLHVEGKAHRGQGAAERAQQLVIAPAAAEGNAVGGVIDLK